MPTASPCWLLPPLLRPRPAAAEAVLLGQGDYRYRVVEGWGDPPLGANYRDGATVCVDSKDNVYVFNRGAHPASHSTETGNTCAPGASREPLPTGSTSSITCHDDGWVYVADRKNHRVQVFDGNGKYQTQWTNLMRPCGLFITRGKMPPLAAIGEFGPETVATLTSGVPNLGPTVSLALARGEVMAYLGYAATWRRTGPVPSAARRHLCGRATYWLQLFGKKPNHELRSMQKLARLS